MPLRVHSVTKILMIGLTVLVGKWLLKYSFSSTSAYTMRNAVRSQLDVKLVTNKNTPLPISPAPQSCVNVISSDLDTENFNCVKLATLKPEVKICIHNVKDDKWVSGNIALGIFWEPNNVELFIKLLNSDITLHAIDIGANVGQYSLVAAHMGRKVLAIEARLLHIHMIQRSTTINGFHDRITLVNNAVSDAHTSVQLQTYDGIQGGTHIVYPIDADKGNATSGRKDIKNMMTSYAILMDDLAAVANFSRAVMKIDIEGYEAQAFRCAQKLFDKVFIPYILMEWNGMKSKSPLVVEPMLIWLQRNGYEVFKVQNDQLHLLEWQKWQKWPFDIILKHMSSIFPH